jgi:hypothetical protein
MILDVEMTKTKVIDLKELCNFAVDKFFIWNYLCIENLGLPLIWNSNYCEKI